MVSWKDRAKKHRAEWCADKHPTLCTAEIFQRRDLPPVMMPQQTPTSTNKIMPYYRKLTEMSKICVN